MRNETRSTNTNTKMKKNNDREIDELSSVDHVVTSAKLSHFQVQLYTFEDNEAHLNHQALTRSICRVSTAAVAQKGRLGLSASGIVPALLFPTHLFALFVGSRVVGSRQWRSSGSVYLFEGVSQCEGAYGGLCAPSLPPSLPPSPPVT